MKGKWAHGTEVHRYGHDDITYIKAAAFLDDGPVEDWGCGGTWARKFFTHPYTGVDGSEGLADKIEDLRTYRTNVHGILLRHVLEHNYDWEQVLLNALASCDKLALVIFTPFGDETKEIHYSARIGVPDMSFKKEDITRHFAGLHWSEETVASDTCYAGETIFYVKVK